MSSENLAHGPVEYEILVRGHLDGRWARRFGDMTVTPLPGSQTRLSGPVADQPALHGILSGIRDLGLELISVQQKKG